MLRMRSQTLVYRYGLSDMRRTPSLFFNRRPVGESTPRFMQLYVQLGCAALAAGVTPGRSMHVGLQGMLFENYRLAPVGIQKAGVGYIVAVLEVHASGRKRTEKALLDRKTYRIRGRVGATDYWRYSFYSVEVRRVLD